MILVHHQVAPGRPHVCDCVCWSHEEDFRHLSFRAGGQQTQVGLMWLFLKVIGSSHMKVFWTVGRFNGQKNVVRTRIIHVNTAPCRTKENIHVNVEIRIIIIIILFFSRTLELVCYCLQARLAVAIKYYIPCSLVIHLSIKILWEPFVSSASWISWSDKRPRSDRVYAKTDLV